MFWAQWCAKWNLSGPRPILCSRFEDIGVISYLFQWNNQDLLYLLKPDRLAAGVRVGRLSKVEAGGW